VPGGGMVMWTELSRGRQASVMNTIIVFWFHVSGQFLDSLKDYYLRLLLSVGTYFIKWKVKWPLRTGIA
jgi:hypothetical protein